MRSSEDDGIEGREARVRAMEADLDAREARVPRARAGG